MKKAIVFEAERTGYGIEQIKHPMTVGELKAILEDFDDDTLFILSHDRGYTYGSISQYYNEFEQEDDDSDFEEA